VLYPLTEICIRMLMTVGIGGRQLMVDILGHRERRDSQQQQNQRDGEAAEEASARSRCPSHNGRSDYHKEKTLSNGEDRPTVKDACLQWFMRPLVDFC
jgi:hypothetical protein